IGNVFLGDDGFGVEVARRLASRSPAPGVTVTDFGIRGLDLAYALQDEWSAAILVDVASRGGEPGTLYVIEATLDGEDAAGLDAHGIDPVRVLGLARRIGRVPPRVLVVGCEAESLEPAVAGADGLGALSPPVPGPPVAAALGAAVELVESLVQDITGTDAGPGRSER